MTLRRTAAALVALALLATACAGSDGSVDGLFTDGPADTSDGSQDGAAPGSDTATSADGSTATGDDPGGTAEGGGPGSDGDVGTGGDGGVVTTGGGTQRVEADDLGPVGANGKPMLRSSYARLVIEVDVQSCTSVDQGAVDHLVSTLRGVVDKPAGIELRGGNTFESDRREWTSADLRANAERNRSTFSGGDEVALYIQYVCGSFHAGGQQSTAIGVAYSASEFGVFPQRWNDGIGVLLGSNRAVERAVLVHEVGHLFGLVNLTYQSEIPHEDPEHPGHSDSRGSVMYWAVESTAIGQVFSGPPPDRFDDADRADLEGLKSGKY
ncbi:MAG TPA: hypothetical protein VGA69_11120 [Nitriliruptorales bacterium]